MRSSALLAFQPETTSPRFPSCSKLSSPPRSSAASASWPEDPPAPPGGFAITQLLNQLLVYSDGYQTKGDLRYPSHVPAPVTGWPFVMIWHGGIGDRKEVQTRCTSLARAGYMTLAVDRRGAGETPVLNGTSDPGSTARQVLDTAELFVLARLGLGALMDGARLGLSGLSAGGASTLQAASSSNQTLPLAGFVARMPRIGAIATDIQSLDWLEDMMPGGGTIVSATLADSVYKAGGATIPGCC